jgi:nucleotide-binding universal stress UspA family protein
VGSHGRTGVARLMLGSVASKVVAESPIPVLVAR